MANTVDPTSLAPMLKRYYTPGRIGSLIYEDAPLLALFKKFEDFQGSLMAFPVEVSEAALATATTAQALINSTLATSVANNQVFHMDVIEKHAWATVSQKVIMQTRTDKGAFLKAGIKVTKDAMISIKKQTANDLYRAGWGKIGVVSAVSGSTITLTNVDDVINFSKGSQLVFSSAESGANLNASGASLIVAGVDRDTGVLTTTAAASGASVLVGDTIFTLGTRDNSGTRLCAAGLDAWLPATAPDSTLFFNVDRTSDSLLSGCRVNGSLSSIEDSLVDGALQVARRGGSLDVFMVSFATYGAILKNASSQIVRDQNMIKQGISFAALDLNTTKGKVKIVPDYACPDGVAYGLDIDTWQLLSGGPLIGQFKGDGADAQRLIDSNGLQYRYYSFQNLVCTAPGWNVRVALQQAA